MTTMAAEHGGHFLLGLGATVIIIIKPDYSNRLLLLNRTILDAEECWDFMRDGSISRCFTALFIAAESSKGENIFIA